MPAEAINWEVLTQFPPDTGFIESWNRLVEAQALPSVFCRFEWAQQWWRAFGSECRLFNLVGKKGNRIVAIAPLVVSKWHLFPLRPLRVLEFLGTSGAIVTYALYIDPPLGRVGMTEKQARDSGRNVLKGFRKMANVSRAKERSETDGFMQVLVDADTKEILGVHMIGVAASELIHFGMLLVHMNGTLDDILSSVFNYPTMSEVYRIAALDGINRL